MSEETAETVTDQEFWDARYGERGQVWSGEANTVLVREAAKLAPGRALDLGCGEGADAIWLAREGWTVTAVDVSAVALGRAAEHAAAAGVAGRVDWQRHDLGAGFPEGSWDLVSAQFLYSQAGTPREAILRRAAAAVAPGGVLLIEGHAGFPSWEHSHAAHEGKAATRFPTPDEVVADLRLPEGEWEVLLSEEHERVQQRPDGTPGTRVDNTVELRRLPV
ncbi:class I SAM-dependent methyltransferase [Streptomyces sp. HNM0574]|uniref:class I SAM-dependent methyltransferase n=1 Tax=Streptomyces sp. HNM0574 TaxID=2714954 RepID=UPI00146DCBAF|nr:class I SAM-dependent methyltransferase [Streptomyces sp. HNM0574]NLU67904.1 methyltransferase domain-containing protein [Streptomyces sp. HNM0574]